MLQASTADAVPKSFGKISSFDPCAEICPSAMTTISSANIQDPLLMGNDQNGALGILSHPLKNRDQILKTPQIDSCLRSSNTESFVPLANTVAISIRFNSPPDKLALTSRLI